MTKLRSNDPDCQNRYELMPLMRIAGDCKPVEVQTAMKGEEMIRQAPEE